MNATWVEVRAWAAGEGYAVSNHGVLSRRVVDAYRRAHPRDSR